MKTSLQMIRPINFLQQYTIIFFCLKQVFFWRLIIHKNYCPQSSLFSWMFNIYYCMFTQLVQAVSQFHAVLYKIRCTSYFNWTSLVLTITIYVNTVYKTKPFFFYKLFQYFFSWSISFTCANHYLQFIALKRSNSSLS